MKCDREQQVIEATRKGVWTSWLRAHCDIVGCVRKLS